MRVRPNQQEPRQSKPFLRKDLVADALAAKKYSFVSAQIEMVPQNYVKLSAEDAEKMEKMLELFDDDDDVQNTWHNWDQD